MGDDARRVILVGFMGSGKSTAGRLLARRLGLCFVETDAMITAREAKSIPEIFAEHGEPYFRRLEAEALDLLSDKRGHVIATGGGFPCRPGVMERLKALGTVVWLAADFEAAYDRANRVGGRPMLAGRTRAETAALYESRQAYYRRAHISINTSHLSIESVVNRILRHLRERGRVRLSAPRVETEPSGWQAEARHPQVRGPGGGVVGAPPLPEDP